MTDLDRAELRRLRDEARSETCRKLYTAAEAKSLALELADDVDTLLDALDAAEREIERLSRIHRGTGKLALSALFLADLDEDTRAVENEVVRLATARAEAAEATLEKVRGIAERISVNPLSRIADVRAALAPVAEEGDKE